jgi:uncharacterized membrane protein
MTWQATGLVTMTVLGAATTGSWRFASGFALISAAIGLVMYVVHEKVWARVAWGRREDALAERTRETGPR